MTQARLNVDKLRHLDIANVLNYGAVGDGVTDDSAAVQTAIDANKGGLIYVPAGVVCYVAGVILDGSSYDGTQIVVDGEIKTIPAPTRTTSNWNSVWVTIGFKDCDRCSIRGNFDGNRANMQQREQSPMIALAGVTNFRSPYLNFREIRGDGVWIGQSNFVADSTNTDGVSIGSIYAYNSAVDGRNAISIISGENITIGEVTSYNVGGVVNGASMPGGLDIEPDYDYQKCHNISVGVVNYYGDGNSGCSIQGRPNDLTVTNNVTIGAVNSIKTNAASLTDGAGGTTVGAMQFVKIRAARNVTIGSINGVSLNSYALAGVNLTNAERVTINGGNIAHVVTGVQIGRDVEDAANAGCSDLNLNLNVDDTIRYGWSVGKLSRAALRGVVTSPVDNLYPGSAFGVHAIDQTISDVSFCIDVPYDAIWDRGYRKDASTPPTLTNCAIRNVSFGPTAWTSFTIMSDMGIPVYNAIGYTEGRATSVPTTGVHVVGQRIYNADPAAGEPLGWICTVAGTPGTWVPFGGIQASNAYTVTNGSTDRAYDANATTVDELADVLGTLIADLKVSGILK